jgi:Ca2+-binding RTX toxin-like protein
LQCNISDQTHIFSAILPADDINFATTTPPYFSIRRFVMVLRVPSTTVTTASAALSLGTLDDARIDAGVLISSEDQHGVIGTGSDQQVVVRGTVAGHFAGVQLGNALGDLRNSVIIGATGRVFADTELVGAAVVVQGSLSHVVNRGELFGRAGITVGGDQGGVIHVENHGVITATSIGVWRYWTGATDRIVFLNTGTVTGAELSYYGNDHAAPDVVINRGLMRGDIDLGDGSDRYDGRGGRTIGTLYGSEGNDVIQLDRTGTSVNGGEGEDRVDFRSARAGVTVNLNSALYFQVDVVIGSAHGDDRLTGDADENDLRGLGGRDVLRGDADEDRLTGGAGRDRLTGGPGEDVFIFAKPGDGGDRITDFGHVVNNSDAILIDGSGFGLTLPFGFLAAGRFHKGPGLHAADGNDRFLFRTGDRTLWFDRDGTGKVAPLLIADLQAGAQLSAGDIVIF